MRKVLIALYVLSYSAAFGCTGTELPDNPEVQNVGLQQQIGSASGAPPLGDGIAPLAGAGGDGAPVVTGSGAAVAGPAGPGAVRWHGGQWIVPYQGHAGSTVANVSCDVIPNATSTDLVELVGPAGVIGSVVVPAATGITIRAWPFVGAYAVPDGGHVVIRHSALHVGTGAWTGAGEDLTIISCAVNAISLTTTTIAATAFVAEDPIHHPIDYIFGPAEGANFMTRATVTVPVGHQIVAARALLRDSSTDPNAKLDLQLISINNNGTNVIASSPVSAGTGALQMLTIAPAIVVQPHTAYFLHVFALGVPSAQDELWFAEVDSN